MVWQALELMQGLVHLRVALIVTSPFMVDLWADMEDKVLETAARVTAPRDFELFLPWEASTPRNAIPRRKVGVGGLG